MDIYVVLRDFAKQRLGRVAVMLLVGVLCALGVATATAASAASLVGKDGVVHACYRVKGKEKGSVRLVKKRQRCRPGERRVQWNVTGSAGAQGPSGSGGSPGATGPAGQAALESKVTTLTTRVEALEGTLKGVTGEALKGALATVNGVTNTELTGALSKLSGVSGAQLQETVASLADVSAVCARVSALTTQTNAIAGALENTVLGGIIPGGLELLVPGLPSALSAFSCP